MKQIILAVHRRALGFIDLIVVEKPLPDWVKEYTIMDVYDTSTDTDSDTLSS